MPKVGAFFEREHVRQGGGVEDAVAARWTEQLPKKCRNLRDRGGQVATRPPLGARHVQYVGLVGKVDAIPASRVEGGVAHRLVAANDAAASLLGIREIYAGAMNAIVRLLEVAPPMRPCGLVQLVPVP